MMPDIKVLKFPPGEGTCLQEQGELQTVCSSRRRSCALVNTPTPCVNKAVCHIHELKRKLENWGQQGGNAQHETANENSHNIIWKFVPTDDSNLCIEGMSLCAQGEEVLSLLWTESTDVLMEVMRLMERLESDRREAERALLEEKEKARKLLKKQESLSLWKLQEFPTAVQREREACSGDIAELKWQLKMRRDQLPQVRDRLTHTEVLNHRLSEDIDFMRKHGPLVNEKLQQGSETLKHIQTSQNEASEMSTNISHKLKNLQQEFIEEELKADIEKEDMKKELDAIRNQQSDRLSEFHQLQSQCEIFHRKIKETEEEIGLKDKQIKALLQEIPQFEKQETEINDAVMTLKAKIEDTETISVEKKEEVTQLQNQIQTTKCEGNEQVSELNATLSKMQHDLLTIQNENEDHKLDIEHYRRKICQSDQAVRQLQKDQKHVLLKISQNEELRKQAKENLDCVSVDHTRTKAELDTLEHQTFLEELRKRKQIEMMNIQITGEMNASDILKGTMVTVTAEYNREETYCKRVKSELQKKYEDALCETAQLEKDVEQLRQIYTEKSKTIEILKAKLSGMHAAHKTLSDDSEQQKKANQEYLNSVKESHHVMLARYEEMTNRIKDFRRKSEDFKQASDTIEETISTTSDVTEELQSMCDAVSFKHATATVVMANLHRDMTSCEQRKSQRAQIHSALIAQRQAVMKDGEANLQNALKDNLELAQEYRELQKALMIAKQEVVCASDKRNRAEACRQDHKQLSLLQKRMHKAMLKHFKHRSVHSQAELARFQSLSNQNNQEMKALQEELSNAIHRLSEFLLSLTDDSTASHVLQRANRPAADADGSSRKMSTVQIAE